MALAEPAPQYLEWLLGKYRDDEAAIRDIYAMGDLTAAERQELAKNKPFAPFVLYQRDDSISEERFLPPHYLEGFAEHARVLSVGLNPSYVPKEVHPTLQDSPERRLSFHRARPADSLFGPPQGPVSSLELRSPAKGQPVCQIPRTPQAAEPYYGSPGPEIEVYCRYQQVCEKADLRFGFDWASADLYPWKTRQQADCMNLCRQYPTIRTALQDQTYQDLVDILKLCPNISVVVLSGRLCLEALWARTTAALEPPKTALGHGTVRRASEALIDEVGRPIQFVSSLLLASQAANSFRLNPDIQVFRADGKHDQPAEWQNVIKILAEAIRDALRAGQIG